MLKTLSPLLSPDLLHLLASMGHGDELVIADANFPADACAKRLVRLDGHGALPVLAAILSLFPVDHFVEEPATVMAIVDDPTGTAPIWAEFSTLLEKAEGREVGMAGIERFEFYERAAQAYGIVATGERALYANLILKKGVVRPD